VGGLWERGFFLRGYEELLIDLHTHPQFAEDLLDALADYHVRTVEILAPSTALHRGISIPTTMGPSATC